MPAHASNSDRIAKAAAEVAAGSAEKAAKKAAAKAAKKPATPRVRKPRAPKAPPRLKIIWGVAPHGGVPSTTYPYAERARADAEVARKGSGWVVTPVRVPMEDPPVEA